MRPSPPGSGVPPPRGLPRGGGTPDPSDIGEIPILDTDPDPGSVMHRWTPCSRVTALRPKARLFLLEPPLTRTGSSEKFSAREQLNVELDKSISRGYFALRPEWPLPSRKLTPGGPQMVMVFSRPMGTVSTGGSRIRDRDRYQVSGSLRDRKDRASLPLAGAPGGAGRPILPISERSRNSIPIPIPDP